MNSFQFWPALVPEIPFVLACAGCQAALVEHAAGGWGDPERVLLPISFFVSKSNSRGSSPAWSVCCLALKVKTPGSSWPGSQESPGYGCFLHVLHLPCVQKRVSKENFQDLVSEGPLLYFWAFNSRELWKFQLLVINLSFFSGNFGRAHTDIAAVLSQGLYAFHFVMWDRTSSVISFMFVYARSPVILCSVEDKGICQPDLVKQAYLWTWLMIFPPALTFAEGFWGWCRWQWESSIRAGV